MDRWKIDELKKIGDIDFAIQILDERARKVSPYSPLAQKIQKAKQTLIKLEKRGVENE